MPFQSGGVEYSYWSLYAHFGLHSYSFPAGSLLEKMCAIIHDRIDCQSSSNFEYFRKEVTVSFSSIFFLVTVQIQLLPFPRIFVLLLCSGLIGCGQVVQRAGLSRQTLIGLKFSVRCLYPKWTEVGLIRKIRTCSANLELLKVDLVEL